MSIDLRTPPPAPSRAVPSPADGRPAAPASPAAVVADLRQAAEVAAPLWPLTSFVAVNPLGGLERLGFARATAEARHWTRGRTQLPLGELRAAVAAGRVGTADIDAAVRLARPDLARLAPVAVAGRWVDPVGIVRRDLLVGPEPASAPHLPRTAGERWDALRGSDVADRVDAVVTAWAARTCAHDGDVASFADWRRTALRRRSLTALVDDEARTWLVELPVAPVEALAGALAALGVDGAGRRHELRGQVARLRGWAGYARWCDEWAAADDPSPRLSLVELVAVRAALEAAAVATDARRAGASPLPPAPQGAPTSVDQLLGERAAAVARDLGGDAGDGAAVGDVLARVGLDERADLALTALERAAGAHLLAVLDGTRSGPALPPVLPDTLPTRAVDPSTSGAGRGRPTEPLAQVACCIDVRSEPLRRQLEGTGPYETIGFAGFFGVAVAVRELGWPAAEARCPVLVRPAHELAVAPRAGEEVAAGRHVRRLGRAGAADHALEEAHHGAASPFALAEAAGWLAGPRAALRTLLPRRRRPVAEEPGRFRLDPADGAGMDLDEQVATAAAVLSTMGLTDGFAPLVVLCGHASRSRNNPHASGLDCGACGGASGADSARVAAALLDDPDVRRGLVARGITIPDGTWFVPAVHDTVTDEVQLLDLVDVPASHRQLLPRLQGDLAAAGAAVAAGRAEGLPGGGAVAARGGDPAQVRPEWGLAGCSTIVVGPRSLTAGVDLGGRAFLHSYEAGSDPEGAVLETILTAPVVVAHWITSQYLFSALDPEALGAGDKLLHNPVGAIGVVTGAAGDLRVGLPRQSTAIGDRRVHEPLRLLVVVDAPRDRVEAIVARNEVLRTLLDGSWVHLVARGASGAWRWRTPGGGWADLDGIPVAAPATGHGEA